MKNQIEQLLRSNNGKILKIIKIQDEITRIGKFNSIKSVNELDALMRVSKHLNDILWDLNFIEEINN